MDGFDGELLRPGDDGYDEARTVFNAMIDKRPAVIARCTSVADVQAAIRYGRSEGMPIAVKAGGHSVAGMSLNDGGLVIDLRLMNGVTVDADARTARAGGGATWGEFDRATQEHGLATTGGRISTTGVAGLTLGGGTGWLERSYGLACDNLKSVALVTASAEVVRASESEHADLFWALHGGGGNFGVATELEFRLHPVGPQVFAGLALYAPEHGVELTRAFRDFYADGPEQAGLGVLYFTAPPEEFVPEQWRGELVAALFGCWNGPASEGESALRPLLAAVEPIVDVFGPMDYADFQCMVDDPPGLRNWWTAEYLAELPDDAVETFVEYCRQMPDGGGQTVLVPWGGAIARTTGTPLAKRDAAWVVHPFGIWESPALDREMFAWGRAARDVFAPYATGGVYLNWIGNEGEDRVRAAFGDAYERLAAVKARYDPENVFRGNQNIRPRPQLVGA